VFDGIGSTTLFGPDLDELVALYVGHLGFAEVGRWDLPDTGPYHRRWRLPPGPLEIRDLHKVGATGGGLRLVGAPSLPPPAAPRTMHRPGPFALDLYVRDLRQLHQRLSAAGYRFRSEPVRYPLFGTDFEVDEVLLEAPLGFVHALVEFLPGRHRCVLGVRPEEEVSEIVAVIHVVEDVEVALGLVRDVLGGQVYLDEVFHGETVERLIGLPSGSRFRATLLRGPDRRNARAELMSTVPHAASEVEPARTHPYLALTIPLPALDPVLARLAADDAAPEPVEFEEGPDAGRRVATLWTGWGATLDLVEEPR
jgi:catechol 2,3-dioxygenase-like lactoylglutathione lyase family enzyme